MIIVNPTTRQFNIPGTDQVFGVTDDASSEIRHFQCPRYVGNNVDVAGSFVRINYRNGNGEIDSYLVQEITVDGSNVLFDWVLSQNATMYKGNLNFVMCVVGPDTKVKWHTTLGRGQVLEGLEPDSHMIEEATVDVIAQLVALAKSQTEAVADTGAEWVRNVQLEGTDQIVAVQTAGVEAKAAAVAEIGAKGANTLNSIPDDYTSLGNAVDSLVRGRAGAIVCEAEGTAIAVKDASENYLQGLRIFGRSTQNGIPTPDAPVEIVSVESPVVTVHGANLANLPNHSEWVNQGITWTTSGGVVTAKGTATGISSNNTRYNMPIIPGTYYISGNTGGVTVYATVRDKNGNPTFHHNTRFVLDGTETQALVYCQVLTGVAVDAVVYPMLNVGDSKQPWTPPIAMQTIETAHPLRGIPVTSGGNYTDENGQQWICDEVDLERGVYVKRVGKTTIDSSFKWYADNQSAYTAYWTQLNEAKRYKYTEGQVLCTMYPDSKDTYWNIGNKRCCLHNPGQLETNPGLNWFYFRNDDFAGLDEVTKFFASNQMDVYYELASYIETPLSETELAAYRALHSNKPNTTILNDSGAHMKVEYAADTKLYIDNKLAALVGNT